MWSINRKQKVQKIIKTVLLANNTRNQKQRLFLGPKWADEWLWE